MASKLPINIRFYAADGRELPGPGGSSGSSEQLLVASTQARRDQVHEIRINYYPNVHRLIFTLPELPGLPEQNQNIDNLFDVHVPFMRFRHPFTFHQNIADLVQMSPPPFRFNYPNTNFFPTTRANTTARALFHELAAMGTSKHHQLVADPERNVIETRPDPIRTFLDKVKKKLGL